MLTLEQVRQLARKVVRETGATFVYVPAQGGATCLYIPISKAREQWPDDDWGAVDISLVFDPEDPREHTACLVGRILDEAGEDRHHAITFHGIGIVGIAEQIPDMLEAEAVDYLNNLQNSQDDGHTWGTAWAEAELRLED